jgi:O-antigen/teichoic acid export membrane protein
MRFFKHELCGLPERLPKKARAKLETNDIIVLKNAFFAFLIKGLALAVSLYSTPAFIRYFDNSVVLGVWYTMLSVLLWVMSFDLGIGNGLRNHLAAAVAAGDMAGAKKYISSALFSIGIITVLFAVLGIAVFGFLDLNALFGVSAADISPGVLHRVAGIVCVGILIRFFLTTINAVLYAVQKSAVNNALSLAASAALLLFVLTAGGGSAEKKLQTMAWGYAVISNLPVIVAAVILFMTTLKDMRPGIKHIGRAHTRAVLSLGVMFFLCQILYMSIAGTNEFFISRLFGPANVVEYQIYYKLTSLAAAVFSLALTPVWSAVTKAAREDNYAWLNRLYGLMKKSGAAVMGLELLLVPIMQTIVNIWLGDEAIAIRTGTALIFAVSGGLLIYQSVLSTVVCGLGRMKLQAVCYAAAAVLKFAVIIIGSRYTDHWALVVLTTAAVLLPYCIAEQVRLNRLFKEKMSVERKS